MVYAAVALLIAACSKEPIEVLEVPAIVQPYVDEFEAEAAARGYDIEINNLIVEFESDLSSQSGEEAAGICRYPTRGEPVPHIKLDTTSYNWQNNEYHREALIFHELGHCILDRRVHTNKLLPNGNFSSIMRATGEQLYGGRLNNFKRTYYLDELFDSTTVAPDWAVNPPTYESQANANRTAIFNDNFNNNAQGWIIGNSPQTRSTIFAGFFYFESKDLNSAFFTTQDIPLDINRDFEIETSFEFTNGVNASFVQWGGSGPEDFYFFGITPEGAAFAGNWTVGLATGLAFDAVNETGFNKLTIRKIGNFYHLYVNEVYFDVFEAESLFGDVFSFYIGPNTGVKIDYLYVNYLE